MHTSKRFNTLRILSTATLIAAALGILLLLYWGVYPYKPLVVHDTEILNVDKTVKQGGNVILQIDYTKNNDVAGVGVRSFVDGIVFQTPSVPGRLPTGSHVAIREVAVPDSLPPGVYHLHSLVEFKMNPIRTVRVEYETDEFTVVAANPHPDAEQDNLMWDGDD